jgi:hypothetical protein
MLRIPHRLDNRLTDGGNVVSPTRRPLLYSPETLFLCFWYSFLLELSKPQGLVGPEELGNLIKIIHLIGSRTRDLPVCNSALTTTLPRAPKLETSTQPKQTPWPLVRERTIPTERPPLVDEI